MQNVRTILQPSTLAEALAWGRQPRAAYLGGGTGLACDTGRRIETLVDLGRLGLAESTATSTGIHVGAMVPLETLRNDPRLPALGAGVVVEALAATRSAAWRRQATLGGRLRQAHPDDLVTLSLIAIDATLHVLAEPSLPPADLPVDAVPSLEATTLILGVEMRNHAAWRFALEFLRLTAQDDVIVAVVAGVLPRDNRVQEARIATCGLGPGPRRARRVEAALEGAPMGSAGIELEAAFAADIDPADDWRATAAYRRHVGAVLLFRALQRVSSGAP